MSGYSSRKEAEQIVRATIESAFGVDPKDVYLTRIYDDLIVGQPGRGWGIVPHEETFKNTIEAHKRPRARGAAMEGESK